MSSVYLICKDFGFGCGNVVKIMENDTIVQYSKKLKDIFDTMKKNHERVCRIDVRTIFDFWSILHLRELYTPLIENGYRFFPKLDWDMIFMGKPEKRLGWLSEPEEPGNISLEEWFELRSVFEPNRPLSLEQCCICHLQSKGKETVKKIIMSGLLPQHLEKHIDDCLLVKPGYSTRTIIFDEYDDDL